MMRLTLIVLLSSFQLGAMQGDLSNHSSRTCSIDWHLLSGTSKRSNREMITNQHRIMREYFALRRAIRSKDIATVQQMLEVGINPNSPGDNFVDPLWYTKSMALTKLLISYGAHIPRDILDARCSDEDYPLELIQFYLDKGCEFVNGHPSLKVALHQLAKDLTNYCDLESTEALVLRIQKAKLYLEHGVSIYNQDGEAKQTALHRAAKESDVNFCEFLVEHEMVHQKEFLTFLLCCKRNFPRFYRQKDLLKALWQSWTPQRLLSMKDADGKTAYDYMYTMGREDWLKPY